MSERNIGENGVLKRRAAEIAAMLPENDENALIMLDYAKQIVLALSDAEDRFGSDQATITPLRRGASDPEASLSRSMEGSHHHPRKANRE